MVDGIKGGKIHSNLLAGKHLYILKIKMNPYVHQDPELNIIAGINDALQDTLSSLAQS